MKVTQEVDRMAPRPILIGALGFVALTLLGVLMAWALQRVAEGRTQGADAERISGRAWDTRETGEEVNGMRTGLFPRSEGRELGLQPAPSSQRLREYGWVDQERQIVHVPLERAKALYLERLRRHPAAAPRSERVER
jgi:hypothetical protein